MTMSRRDVLGTGAAAAASMLLPRDASAQAAFAPRPGAWRSFQTVTQVEIRKDTLKAQAWVPLPAFNEPEWFRPGGSTWTSNAETIGIKRDPNYGAEFLHVVWSDDVKAPLVEVTSKFSTRDRAIDLTVPRQPDLAQRRRSPPLHRGNRPDPDQRDRQANLRQDRRRRH